MVGQSFNFDLSETKNRLRRNYRQQHNLDKARAVWGDAFGNVPDPNRPGKVYVRVMTSNGLSVARSVWAPRIPFGVKVGDPVKLKYEDGRLMVDGPDHAAMLSAGTNPVARATQLDSGSTPQSDLETLNLTAKGGYLVSLKGWNVITNGVYYEVSFPDIDLEPYLPASGEMCYAGIFALADLSGVDIVTSTPVSIPDLIGRADVQECLDAATPGDTPAWAVLLNGDMTEITAADIDNAAKDLRQLVNSASTAQVFPRRAAWFADEFTTSSAWVYDRTATYVVEDYQYVKYQSVAANGDYFTVSASLAAGTYTLTLKGATELDCGLIDYYLDGVLVASAQDWYTLVRAFNVEKTVTFSVPSGGYHVIKALINGKHASSTGYYFVAVKMWIKQSAD